MMENERALRNKAEELQKTAEEKISLIENDFARAQEKYRETLLELGKRYSHQTGLLIH